MAETNFVRLATAVTAPDIKRLDCGFKELPVRYVENTGIGQDFNFVFESDAPYDPEKGWGFELVGYSMMLGERLPNRGDHLMAQVKPEIPVINLTDNFAIAVRDTYSIDKHKRIADKEKFLTQQLTAFYQSSARFFEFLLWYLFVDDTQKLADPLFKDYSENTFAKSDGESNGYPFMREEMTFEAVKATEEEKKNYAKTNPLKKRLDLIKTAIKKNSVEVDAAQLQNSDAFTGTPEFKKLCKFRQGIKKTIREITGRTRKYFLDENEGKNFPFTVNPSDLVLVMSEDDLTTFENAAFDLRHPDRLAFTAESLGVGKVIITKWKKKGNAVLFHKDALKIKIDPTETEVGSAVYAEHGITNIWSRLLIAPILWKVFPWVNINIKGA